MGLDGGVPCRRDLRLLLQVVHPLMEVLLVVAGHQDPLDHAPWKRQTQAGGRGAGAGRAAERTRTRAPRGGPQHLHAALRGSAGPLPWRPDREHPHSLCLSPDISNAFL